MGTFGKLAMLGSARKAAKRNPGPVHRGIDSVASLLKGRLGARHAGTIDKGVSFAKRAATGTDRAMGSGRRAA
jgi:hypothetical protein